MINRHDCVAGLRAGRIWQDYIEDGDAGAMSQRFGAQAIIPASPCSFSVQAETEEYPCASVG